MLGGTKHNFENIQVQVDEFAKQLDGYEVRGAAFDDLVYDVSNTEFRIKDTKNQMELKDYDIVMIRGKAARYLDLAFCVSIYSSENHLVWFNDYSLAYPGGSKLAQAVIFYQLKVPFIRTLYSIDRQLLLSYAKSELRFPLILKDVFGSHGNDNHLVDSAESAASILDDNQSVYFIAQPYHPNNCDYRVLIIGRQQPLQIKRSATSGSHLNNTSQGASAEKVSELPVKILEQADRIRRAFKMTVAGVDVLQDTSDKNYYFLEVNSQPQLATGAFIPDKIAALQSYLNQLGD